MMDRDKQGGAAFPTGLTPGHYSQEGMSLRDWFAGMSLISDPGNNPNLPDDPASTSRWPDAKDLAERRAKWAYHQADAMLAARAKP